jgi:hypothetical protein
LVEDKIQSELHLSVVKRVPDLNWNIQIAAQTLTDPRIVLAVFNNLDEISLLEIGLLLFLCRPILITDRCIEEYKILMQQVNFVETSCNLKEPSNVFVSWYTYMEKQWVN